MWRYRKELVVVKASLTANKGLSEWVKDGSVYLERWLCARCVLQVCREGPFTATGVCLCCYVRPFSSHTEPGFFSSPLLNEGLTVFRGSPGSARLSSLPVCPSHPTHSFLFLSLPQNQVMLPHWHLHRPMRSGSAFSLFPIMQYFIYFKAVLFHYTCFSFVYLMWLNLNANLPMLFDFYVLFSLNCCTNKQRKPWLLSLTLVC